MRPLPGGIAALGECMVEVADGDGGTARLGFGGDTLNTAVYLARACRAPPASSAGPVTPRAVRYVTALGDDPLSERMVTAWAAEGIVTDLVYRLPGRLPGLYLISTDERGERRFFYWREHAAARSLLDEGRARSVATRLAGTALLYLSGVSLAILSDVARRALLGLVARLAVGGTQVAFDSNHRPRLWPDAHAARTAYAEVAAHAAIVLPSAADEMALFGDDSPAAVARRWRAAGVEEVVVKDGDAPCVVAFDDVLESVPPPVVVSPVDTTAAGDSFNAAYLAARLAGARPSEAARRGHILAAEVIGHPGALTPRGS